MLTWDWNESFGYVVEEETHIEHIAGKEVERKVEFKHKLYEGNAMLIQIWESETDKRYMITNFLCDREHFRNCLKDRNGDWLFANVKKVVFTKNPPKDVWLWIMELVKRGKEVNFLSRPF